MKRTTWELELKSKGSAAARAMARDIRDLDASLRSLRESSGVLGRVSNDVGALRAARVRVQSERRVASEVTRTQARARTEMTDSERMRRVVEKAQQRGQVLDGQRRYRAWQERVRGERRAQQQIARQNSNAWRRDVTEMARQERFRSRQAVQAARTARRAQEREERTTSSRRNAVISGVAGGILGGGALAIGAGLGIAGVTMSALSTLASMAGTAAELTANLGGSVLQMIAFREASLTTLRVMARDANGQRLTGGAAAMQAREQFGWAQQFARETPLDAQQVLDLQRQTSAAGFYGSRNRDVVAAAADVGAFNPNDEGAAGRFLLGLGQLRNASTVRLQDLRQTTSAAGLSEADTLRAIARAAGVNRNQGEGDAAFNSRLQRMQSQGRFTGAQGVEGVLAALRERNGGELGSFARSQGDSLMGTLSNLRGAIFDFVTSIDNIENLGGIKTLKAELNDIVRLFTGTGATATRARTAFAGMVNDGAQFIGELGGKHGLEDTMNNALDVFEQLRPVVTEIVRAFGPSFWLPVSTELRAVFELFKGGDIRETAMHAARLGQALGLMLAYGIDITVAMAAMSDQVVILTGNLLQLTDMLIQNPEMIQDVFSDLPGTMQEIGRQIPAGMREGLMAEAPGFLVDVRSFNADIASVSRESLKIHSPSRVFADIGSQIPAGMAQGIDGGTRDVTRAMGGMVTPQGLPGFDGAGLSGLGGGGGITIGEVHLHVGGSGSEGGDIAREFVDELERMAAMGGA